MSNFIDLQQRLEKARRRLQETHKDALAVDAETAILRKKATQLQHDIAQANYRESKIPAVQAGIQALVQRSQQRSVGIYEELLTALVQDVIPENIHPVSLVLTQRAGLPELKIQLGKKDRAQDIFDDTGGSLTNVVSAGLRFVALARSPLRKFLILDEPDCWIEPHRIPRFVDILSGMAGEGIQAILISHHNDSMFASIPDRMRLEKNASDKIIVRSLSRSVWKDNDTPGIRWVRLQNFMSHEDTYLELGPGINCLSGANHIGKSAVVNAFRVFNYGRSADRHIRHGANSMTISFGIEKGKILSFTRYHNDAKTKPKNKIFYTFFDPADTTRKEPRMETGADVPDFVLEQMNIRRLNNLDIQLSHQKMPVFLLNEPGSTQASILSAGQEADYGREFAKLYKSWCDEDRSVIKIKGAELAKITQTLTAWDTEYQGASLASLGIPLDASYESLSADVASHIQLSSLEEAWSKAIALGSMKLPQGIPVAPVLTPTEPLYALAKNWSTSIALSEIRIPEKFPTAPDVSLLQALIQDGKNWAAAYRKMTALNSVVETIRTIPEVPTIASSDLLAQASAYAESHKQMLQRKEQAKAAQEEHANSEKDLQALIKELGGHCPTCKQAWPHYHEDNQ